MPSRNNLPPAVVLPERLIHRTGRVIPGQFAGMMGAKRDPWFINAAPFRPDELRKSRRFASVMSLCFVFVDAWSILIESVTQDFVKPSAVPLTPEAAPVDRKKFQSSTLAI